MTRDKFKVSKTWIQAQHQREIAIARKTNALAEAYNSTAHPLTPIHPGMHVICQNQLCNHPTRWGKTGLIIGAKAHRQYTVKMDGSGRITTRNRRFLFPISPNYADTPHYPPTAPGHPTPPQLPNNHVKHQPNVRRSVMKSEDNGIPHARSSRIATTPQYPRESATDTSSPTGHDSLQSTPPAAPQWPAKLRQAPRCLSPYLCAGQSYDCLVGEGEMRRYLGPQRLEAKRDSEGNEKGNYETGGVQYQFLFLL